jgi:hypothetical protein
MTGFFWKKTGSADHGRNLPVKIDITITPDKTKDSSQTGARCHITLPVQTEWQKSL